MSCKKSPKPSKVSNVVVISDTHAGCRLALCPPDGVKVDDGGYYFPEGAQKKLWGHWEEFWNDWVPKVTEGEPFHVVHNGDAVEGIHHRSTTQISHNTYDQRKIGYRVLAPIAEKARASGGNYYHVRGTEAHVGSSACDEEALAEQLQAVPNEQGQYARWDLWMNLGDSLIQFLHHIGTISSMAYEGTALSKEVTEVMADCARWGTAPPDMICRGHRHRCYKVEYPTSRGRGIAIVGPGWQMKTPFAYKIAGARVSQPQFGGYVIRKKHGILYTLERVWTIDRSKTEMA